SRWLRLTTVDGAWSRCGGVTERHPVWSPPSGFGGRVSVVVAAKLGATMADRRDLWNLGSAFVGQAIVTTASVSMGVWQFVRDLRELVSALVRITAPGGVLDRLADLPDTLRPFAAHAESISESLRQIATLAESLERLSKVAESLPALADRAAALPEVV